ncbi:MAG TPA: glycoside hydrolase family 3 C-terminal domain-containing protein [Cellulomonas sp.]
MVTLAAGLILVGGTALSAEALPAQSQVVTVLTATDDASTSSTDDASSAATEESDDSGVDWSRFGQPDNSELSSTLTDESTETSADQFVLYARIGVGVIGAIVLVVAVLFLLRTLRNRRRAVVFTHRRFFNGTVGGVAVVLVGAIVAANALANYYTGSLNNVFSTSQKGDASVTTTEADWKDLAATIAEEGMVLLRNDGDSLPLDTSSGSTKVNLLGYYGYNPLYSGAGSGSVSASDAIDVLSSLEAAGIEVNSAPVDEGVYDVQSAEDKGVGFSSATFSIDEVSIDSYQGTASFASMKEYSDTAVVVLGRTGGEGTDLTDYGVVDGADYLQLSTNERALLQEASETFDNLVVVINSANAMELGFLDEYGVDAAVWAGLPGPYGFAALGEILTGAVNPSAKLPDTWVYDNDSAPANENYGDQQATNSDDSAYVDYVEGIYVGYKWYETAYAEQAVVTTTSTGETFDYGNDYDSIVAYPFGYGLSYTTFERTIAGGLSDGDSLDPTGTYSVDVEVTNTGDVAGKDVVELYVTVPYTEYDAANGVEKAAVSLVGYAKTDELQPGESQTVSVEVSMEDIASYDSSHDNGDGTTGSYLLDEGDYEFSLRSDVHTVQGTVTAQLAEQHFFSGDDKRSTDDQAASNQFDDAARGEYLSRQDGFANYDSAMASVSSEVVSTAFEDDPSAYDEAYDEAVTEEYVEGEDYAVDGDLTLDDLVGASYDDERWSELVSQLTLEELQSLVTDATYTSPALESIGTVRTMDSDGPLGISSLYNSDINGVGYPCIPLLAATFNVDLASEFGSQMADQAHDLGITGWYAPAMNTHRSAYSGRNFEYYSEDSYLAGAMAASEVQGAREKGLIVYIKHFALNDQETNRSSNLHTYSNEQAIREIYLKPFEAAVKDGGATALMSSMNFIGDTYVPTSEALLTEVLRNEWGFRGKTLTDMTSGETTKSIDAALRAGTDSWLTIDLLSVSADTDADIYYLQRTAHNILYEEANATTIASTVANWKAYVYLLSVELGVLFAICVTALVLRNRRFKRTQAAPAVEA